MGAIWETAQGGDARQRVLVVDDDAQILRFYAETLGGEFEIEQASSAGEALKLLENHPFDTAVVDVMMPDCSGLEFLKAVRAKNLDLPVMLVSGAATLETALKAMEYGAFRYLTKPVDIASLRGAIRYGVRLSRMAHIKRLVLDVVSGEAVPAPDPATLEARFEECLRRLWIAYQPIVSCTKKVTVGYEALVRSDEPALSDPGEIFEAAESLDRLPELGAMIRKAAARSIPSIPSRHRLFVNLHPSDFDDPALYDPAAPLSQVAKRVVLEVSERASLETIRVARPCLANLRRMGFRLAIDDLGAGNGLSTFTQLEPEIVKLDMSLVRGADLEPMKAKLIQSMTALCRDLAMVVVAEGIETAAESSVCLTAGCDLQQGFLFGRPSRAVLPAAW